MSDRFTPSSHFAGWPTGRVEPSAFSPTDDARGLPAACLRYPDPQTALYRGDATGLYSVREKNIGINGRVVLFYARRPGCP